MAPVLLICLAAFAALAFESYRRDLARAKARIAAGSRIAGTPAGPVEYATAGSGPVILVVHGAGGGFDQGLDIGSGLAARGCTVVAMSRFGYLRTPLPADASAAAQADAHAALMEALGLARAVVLGVSAGAPSALQLAIRHPHRVAALALLVPAAYADTEAARGAAPRFTIALLGTALRFDFLWWLAARIARRVLYGAVLAAPTLAISAEDDLYGTAAVARDIAARVEGARLVIFARGGHLCAGHGPEVDRLVAALAGRDAT